MVLWALWLSQSYLTAKLVFPDYQAFWKKNILLKHVKTIQTRFLDNFRVSPTSIVSVVVANMRSNIYISLSGAHGKENTKPQHALVKRYEEKFKHCN